MARVQTLAFNEDVNQIIDLLNHPRLGTTCMPTDIKRVIADYAIGFHHSFSQYYHHGNVHLFRENKSARMRQEDGWSRRVDCNQVMRAGVHFIEFRIDVLRDDMSIGISNLNRNINRFVGFDSHSYSLACGGKLQHDSDADYADPYAQTWKRTPYKSNDTIAMLLDLNKYTLSYIKNGQYIGKAFDIRKAQGYVFAVSMAYWGDQISIVS